MTGTKCLYCITLHLCRRYLLLWELSQKLFRVLSWMVICLVRMKAQFDGGCRQSKRAKTQEVGAVALHHVRPGLTAVLLLTLKT